MTKLVRVENADATDHKVHVYVEDLQADGTWVREPVPRVLNYPAMMLAEYIHGQRRLVVEEAAP